ncbi:MAG: hypothetical protein U0361_10400 [Nitrospiraceae bacterium]
MAGEIPQERDRAAFTFDGTLVQSAPDPAQRETTGQLQMEGDAQFHRVDVPHLISAWTPLQPISDGLRGSAQASAHLRLTPRMGGYDLSADTWSVTLSDLSLQGSAGDYRHGKSGTAFGRDCDGNTGDDDQADEPDAKRLDALGTAGQSSKSRRRWFADPPIPVRRGPDRVRRRLDDRRFRRRSNKAPQIDPCSR